MPNPVITPCPFAYTAGRRKSVKPPRTRNEVSGFLRGYAEAKEGCETVAHILVNFPTLPHLEHRLSKVMFYKP